MPMNAPKLLLACTVLALALVAAPAALPTAAATCAPPDVLACQPACYPSDPTDPKSLLNPRLCV